MTKPVITRAKLERFVKTRNESMFNSNLQFQIDAEQCGLTLEDLGTPEHHGDGGYLWRTALGLLEEDRAGRMRVREWFD